MRYLSEREIAQFDPDQYPHDPLCGECGSDIGHTEELWTGHLDGDKLSGWEVWFCCHACRDAGKQCETFHPIRVKPGSVVCG